MSMQNLILEAITIITKNENKINKIKVTQEYKDGCMPLCSYGRM